MMRFGSMREQVCTRQLHRLFWAWEPTSCSSDKDPTADLRWLRLLFAHLGTLPRGELDAWQDRFHIVQSKVSANPAQRATFGERMASLAAKYLSRYSDSLEVEIDATSLSDTFELDWSEDDAQVDKLLEEESVHVLAVLEDERFRIFDPITDRDILRERAYSDSFQELLELTRIVVPFVIRKNSVDASN